MQSNAVYAVQCSEEGTDLCIWETKPPHKCMVQHRRASTSGQHCIYICIWKTRVAPLKTAMSTLWTKKTVSLKEAWKKPPTFSLTWKWKSHLKITFLCNWTATAIIFFVVNIQCITFVINWTFISTLCPHKALRSSSQEQALLKSVKSAEIIYLNSFHTLFPMFFQDKVTSWLTFEQKIW